MREYHCVDLLNLEHSEDIKASSPDIAMKRYFKMCGISERPVRSAKQTHKREYDCRFHVSTNFDNSGYRVRHSFIGFNREGYEYYGCRNHEFKESSGQNLSWNECGDLA